MRSAFTYILAVIALLHASAAYALPRATQQEHSRSDQLFHFLEKMNRKDDTANAPVTVILEAAAPLRNDTVKLVESEGGKFRFARDKQHEIQLSARQAWRLLKKLPQDIYLRLPYPHRQATVISEGVEITGASDMQQLGNGGAGVKVGIIDLGFSSYFSSITAGELPAGLSIVDYTGTGFAGTNHGTNVAEIVHDMAPQAELYLAKVSTTLQLEQAKNDMVAAGVSVINHSVAWFGTAFYDGTGPICDITDAADSAGTLWVNAMGNSRRQHYLGTFTDTNGNLRHEFSPGVDSNTVSVVAGNTYSFVLNWDAYPRTNIDYDLYLYNGDPNSGGSVVASSTANQNGNFSSTPYEAISHTANTTAEYHLVVRKGNGDANVPLTLFSLDRDLGTQTRTSSIVQPADCQAVLSVGATDLQDGAEYFSSEGPTTDGRDKPEITAPDRNATSLTTSFAGTSSSSPHAAGAAALLLSQNPGISPLQIRQSLIATAHDISTAGFDFRTGFGRISLDADEDGFNHDTDNCLVIANPTQLDTDIDLQGNACDLDDDNDGLVDTLEILIGSDSLLVDTDDDGLSDYFEVAFDGNDGAYVEGEDLNPLVGDTDGDTLSDYDEVAWDGNASTYIPGSDLNPLSSDTDGDGYLDAADPIPFDFNYADADVAPLGAPDGQVDIADYVIYQRLVQQSLTPTVTETSHGDIYPAGAPDGVIDMSDFILLQNILKQVN